MHRFILLNVLVALGSVCAIADEKDVQAERLRRFNELKFGMFIHWGPYSLASVEASWPIMRPKPGTIPEAEYRALKDRFNPDKFDAKSWVKLAQEAGQKYMVFTTKHHDGFCMFDSSYTDHKITRTPYKKDIVAQLVAAAKDERMPLGFYYSPPDLNHPGYRDTSRPSSENWIGQPERPEWPLYLAYMELQVRELLTRYGDVFVIWFDGLGNLDRYDGRRFQDLVRGLQPTALINDRVGVPGDYSTPEQWVPAAIPVKGVEPTQEQTALSSSVPSRQEFQPWETCMTINDTWAYNVNDKKFKSKTELIRALIEVASRGGNFLLNVGPAPDGTIQQEFADRLRGIGAWLKVNGEAIYGTTYGPLQSLPYARTTAKGNTVYLHVFDWPAGEIELKGLKGKVTAVRTVAGNHTLPFTDRAGVVRIAASGVVRDPDATVLAIQIRQ